MAHSRPPAFRLFPSASFAGVLLLGAALQGCGLSGGSGGILFLVRNTKQGVAGTAKVRVSERWLLYQAEEATTGPGGTDFNVDGDKIDSIAAVVNMASVKETVLNTQADDLAVLGANLYLVTDEAKDDFDWNVDGDKTDIVLLHCPAQTASLATVAFLATLDPASALKIALAGGRLYFVEERALALGETSLTYVTSALPTSKQVVPNSDAGSDLDVRLLGVDEDLVFLYADEVVEAADLNGDADSTDGFVLALLDAKTSATQPVRSVGKALENAAAPFRALSRASDDWIVAFLVNEAAQGAVNLNDPTLFSASWKPAQCATFEDADTLDDVLAWLQFKLWVTDAAVNPPINTGLVGTNRVLAVATSAQTFVGTGSLESDEGTCSLNGDADTTDTVLRWVKVETGALPPVLPFTNVTHLVALDPTPGGTAGASDLDDRFIVVVDEAADSRDHDGNVAVNNTLAAWLDPTDGNGAAWTYDHNGAGTAGGFVGVAWMADRPQRDRLLTSFQESVFGQSINVGGDNDELDSAPTFCRFDPSNQDDLDFPGANIAVDDDNAGIAIGGPLGFFRVDEAADNRDWNGGGKTHFVLFRTTFASLQNTNLMGTLNNLARPSVETDGKNGAAFVSDESMDGKDLNKDGDQNDFVVRWFRIG